LLVSGERALNPAIAVLAPVPPSAIARSVMPVMEPPLIETLAEDCLAMATDGSKQLAPASSQNSSARDWPRRRIPAASASVVAPLSVRQCW
jgi:hypothetical protein